ncbi:MAG: DUF2812 domain-containing protein [Anaerotignum sp.]|nr:DUF2812 domain-containing protein [Anaerotignum sp.]
MEKDGKRIKRWKGGMDTVQTAGYLRDMAAEGWILEESGYLFYIFREETPQDLTYRLVTMKNAPTGEELAKYEAEGWKKVTHWEEEYIFVKERDIWDDDALERQMMIEEIDRQLEREKTDRKATGILGLVLFAFFGIILFMQYGTDLFFEELGMHLFVNFGPSLFFLIFGGWLVIRRLRKKKERLLDGETVSAGDTDWKGSRIRAMIAIVVGFSLIGWALYLEAGWNEKITDLPMEIDYREVPAVRLERIEDAKLVRTGKDVETQKANILNVYGPAFLGWHSYDNAVRDHGMLIIMEETETEQRMRPEDGDGVIELSTDYCDFLFAFMAEKEYKEQLDWENDIFEGDNRWDARVVQEMDAFDETHICKKKFTGEAVLHILCRQGKQIMELEYTGQAEQERILEEIAAVFDAQK